MGQRLRQAAHRVTGALIERAQRRSKSRVLVTKERIETHEQVHCLLQKRMAFLLFGLERIVVRFPETSASLRSLVLKRFTERRMLVVAPRLVESFGFVVGEVRDDVPQRVPERGFIVETTAPPFVDGALHPFLLAAVMLR